MPERCPEPDYLGNAEVREVSANGAIRFRHQVLFITGVLEPEYVGLEEVDDRVWALLFHDRLLGRLDERTWTIHRGQPD